MSLQMKKSQEGDVLKSAVESVSHMTKTKFPITQTVMKEYKLEVSRSTNKNSSTGTNDSQNTKQKIQLTIHLKCCETVAGLKQKYLQKRRAKQRITEDSVDTGKKETCML